MKFVLIAMLLMLVFFPYAAAQTIDDPENVTFMKVEIVQSGQITLASQSSLSSAEDLTLSLYIPQSDSRQSYTISRIIGPDSHVIGEDKYGNAQITMLWENPQLDKEIDYLVETIVEIRDKSSGENKNFPVTSVTEPSQGIIETAYTVGGGEKSVENMLLLSNWVYDNTEYDLSCEREAFAAKWVYDEGRGTCDEFSNLLLSMMKTLDYDAWYVAGYAYLTGKQQGGESFGAHAWVEARLDGKTYSLDPTWAESPVDATHITFARLPDSNFTEHTEVKSRDISLNWEKDETRLELVSYKESPRISTDLQVFPETVWGGKNVMIIADLSADGCVATNLRAASCINEGGDDLVEIGTKKRAVSFCDSARFYWFGETPKIAQGMRYTCPVTVAAGGGIKKAQASITSEPKTSVGISASTKKIAMPGEQIDVQVSLNNGGFTDSNVKVFAVMDNVIKEKNIDIPGRGTGSVQFQLTVPQMSGEYDLNIFADSGDLKSETIEVISERQMKIDEIQVPSSMKIGDSGEINVTVSNNGEESTASVKFQSGGTTDTETVTFGSDGKGYASFGINADSEGSVNVIVSLLDNDGSYQDSWTGNINVMQEASLKEGIAKQLEGMIMSIIEAIMSIFGMLS